jgi:hypothetical protein
MRDRGERDMARDTNRVTETVSIQGGVRFEVEASGSAIASYAEVQASGSTMVEILNAATNPHIYIRVTDVYGKPLASFGLEKSGEAVVFASQLKHAIESVSKDAQTLAAAHYQERQAESIK